MYHRVRKKMSHLIYLSAIVLLSHPSTQAPKSIDTTTATTIVDDDSFDNQIVDFDEEYTIKFNKKYGMVPWHANDFRDSHKYTIFKNKLSENNNTEVTTEDLSVIPIELMSTTENELVSIVESTTEQDLTVISLSTTKKTPKVIIDAKYSKVTLPTTESSTENDITTESIDTTTSELYTSIEFVTQNSTEDFTKAPKLDEFTTRTEENQTVFDRSVDSKEEDVQIFTELDTEEIENVPEDYYDAKDVVPTSAPKTDAISVLFGFAGSVVESVVETVAEKVVPKTIYDLFKRMQRQNEALEAERLRSREENGGIGQFGRGILKTISTGITKPLSQLMTTAKEAGSLDTDRGFVSSVASGVTSVANVANSVVDAFKDKVQAIYPGTVWCGDGHSANARSSSELGLFFFTDTCCRQHDACKIYIKAGETKYGLTNTGLFTRSHCGCDAMFRECLRRTNSLVSAQIGLTYFNVLGPQCFRKTHPIVKCVRRTRITSQRCEEYELDYTKPKMWQWFDNETF